MKILGCLLFLVIMLSSCRNNALPSTPYEPDNMMNQYLFGPLSMKENNKETIALRFS